MSALGSPRSAFAHPQKLVSLALLSSWATALPEWPHLLSGHSSHLFCRMSRLCCFCKDMWLLPHTLCIPCLNAQFDPWETPWAVSVTVQINTLVLPTSIAGVKLAYTLSCCFEWTSGTGWASRANRAPQQQPGRADLRGPLGCPARPWQAWGCLCHGGDSLGTSLEESVWILPPGISLPPSPKGYEEDASTGDEVFNRCHLGETFGPTSQN